MTHDAKPFDLAMVALSVMAVIVVLLMTFASLDAETTKLLFFIDTGICMIFIIHFAVGLHHARCKMTYCKLHWIDLLASIPAIEAFRFARVFQILRIIRLICLSRAYIVALLRRRNEATLASLLVAMVAILAFSSVIILIAESGHEGANIHTAEQAIWWSLVTISTVGYGDYYPVTTVGHVLGGIVLVSGVSFFWVITGYMASIFVVTDETEQQVAHENVFKREMLNTLVRLEQQQAETLAELAELKQTLKERTDDSSL